jgi:nicotinamide phosphoribosyltransferase
MTDNIMLLTDSYKLSHYHQYPPGTEKVYSYFESRVGAEYPETMFFGLQYFIKKYLMGQVVTQEKIDEANEIADLHMGPGVFNREGWQRILNEHDGRLPVEIKAVPEGSKIPTGNVLMTIENTDPACYWLPNYLETLLVQVWYPSTVATISSHVRDIIRAGLIQTGDVGGLDFKLHDFGFRGVSSVESAGIGGLAHLVNFKGSDTLAAIVCGRKFYGEEMAGCSIPASEHSTMTSWGEEGEADAYRNMLEKYPTGLVACVSDSYDIENACSKIWGETLRDEVLERDGVLVVRPDSGEIVSTVIDVMERLYHAFGGHNNVKGFTMLHDNVRVIQGDGCTPETIEKVINAMYLDGWSIDNIAFGMGGGLLQKLDRDTQKFAFKCSAALVGGEWRDVYKRPKTDPTKNSKRGRLTLTKGVTYDTVPHGTGVDVLVAVFRDGELLVDQTLEEIREVACLTT